jgi:hypothetical protein
MQCRDILRYCNRQGTCYEYAMLKVLCALPSQRQRNCCCIAKTLSTVALPLPKSHNFTAFHHHTHKKEEIKMKKRKHSY